MSAFLQASNVLCPIGRGSAQAWASARAGIARITSSNILNSDREPIPMGLVPDDALTPLPAEIDALPLPARARRMLRLAGPALAGMSIEASAPLRLFLGLPELPPQARWLNHFPKYLQILSKLPIDAARSTMVPRGRASALMALQLALDALRQDPASPVIVGGVDTYFDQRLLSSLDAENRLLGRPEVMDGFIAGEGAAFLLVSSASSRRGDVRIDATATSMDAGHRYGTAPALGEGLADALLQLRQQLPSQSPPVMTTFAGFNGEHFDAKLWGVAQIRHRDFFAPSMLMEHPADKYGDAGAASGAILIAMAATALAGGTRPGPALVWAASDREPRACALLTTDSN